MIDSNCLEIMNFDSPCTFAQDLYSLSFVRITFIPDEFLKITITFVFELF